VNKTLRQQKFGRRGRGARDTERTGDAEDLQREFHCFGEQRYQRLAGSQWRIRTGCARRQPTTVNGTSPINRLGRCRWPSERRAPLPEGRSGYLEFAFRVRGFHSDNGSEFQPGKSCSPAFTEQSA